MDGNFNCRTWGLRDFKGVRFGNVSKDFRCEHNQLTTLVGAPQSVGRSFDCDYNQLTSLVGAPQSVGSYFNCSDNQLTSLEGAPQSVGGVFYCDGNTVTASTLAAIFALMKKGMAYQQALEERWPEMADEDKVLMYKEMPSLSPEDIRKYQALATYNNIKDYL